jgi:transcriptional regulator with XRE-family HTH domain
LTLHSLAGILGVSAKQLQKYETGTDQIFSSRLQQIAGALDIPLDSLFEEASIVGFSIPEAVRQPDTIRLARAFCKITNETTRTRIRALVDAVSSEECEQSSHFYEDR